MKKQSIKKTISALGLLLAGLSFAQSTTENFVQSKNCLNDDCSKKAETITYFDGLGRPKQVIMVKSTVSGKDLVTPITYDGFGRQVKDILPVAVDTQNSLIHSSITNENTANTYYGVSNAYSEKQLENSPLDRILQQANAGEAWKMSSGYTQKFTYEANSGTEVKRFGTNTSINTVNTISNTVSVPFVSSDNSGNYPAGTLYKNTVTDEDGNPVVQFTNAQGQTLLIRRTDGSQNIDTYYVYNEYSQLAFVISPKAVKQIEQNNNVITEAILNELCYQYKYDGKTRLVEKKLPGKDWEFMVYDKQDRLVLMQDGLLRTTTNNFLSKGWIFTKYDEFGRVAYTGFFTNSANRQAMQSALNNMSANASNNEKRSDSSFNLQGIDVYYDKKGFPTGSMTLLTVNYYDTYPLGAPAVPTTVLGQYTLSQTLGNNQDASTNSLPTASFVKNIEDNNWTKTFNYYDTKGRLVASKSTNHLGGYTNKEMKLDFTGAITESYTSHKRSPNDTEVNVKEKFIYDDQKRLVKQYHQVDNNPEELLAENTYNDLNELINKKTGNNLQSIDYAYNIRGWMTSMNNPDNLGNDLFGYKINYTQVEGLETPNQDYSNLKVKPKFNGNISEVSWKTLTEDNEPLKRYGYVYDPLNRLSAGFYQKSGSENAQEYFEKLDYDVNGNITRLKRSAGALPGTTIATVIDNLKYDYSGNRLSTVKDEQQNPSGYPYVSTPNSIGYDVNGNMTDHLDKEISSIKYNYLNLPKQITQSSKVTNYTYRADGVKVKKLFGDLETDYLDGFQYKSTFASEENIGTGLGGIIVDPDPTQPTVIKLRIIPTSEGYYDALNKLYIYNYTDHLGNVRLSYSDTNKDGTIQPRQYFQSQCENIPWDPWNPPSCIDIWKPGEIVEVNNYYPFGMLHNYTETTQNAYQYKYNGKELQETGMYDYGARMYMPDIGRWGVIDNKAEKFFPFSSYAYAINNPIRYLDPDGNEIIIWYKASDGKMHSYDYKYGAGYTGKNKYLVAFHKAANALIESGAGGNLKGLTARKEKVWVRQDTYENDLGPAFDRSAMSITWKPTAGGDNNNDGITDSTPTALLDHELDHALGYVTDPVEYIKRTKTPDKDYDNKEEKRVITGSEQSTAKKLGLIKNNQVTRKGHKGSLTETAGVNTVKPKASQIEEVVIKVKKKK